MLSLICAVGAVVGLLCAASDGPMFPWINLLGVLTFSLAALALNILGDKS